MEGLLPKFLVEGVAFFPVFGVVGVDDLLVSILYYCKGISNLLSELLVGSTSKLASSLSFYPAFGLFFYIEYNVVIFAKMFGKRLLVGEWFMGTEEFSWTLPK